MFFRVLFFLILLFLTFYFLFSLNFTNFYGSSIIGKIFHLPPNYIISRLFNLKITLCQIFNDKIIIGVKNDGLMFLTKFEVYLDGTPTKVLRRPIILLPGKNENIEIESRNFSKIKLVSNYVETEYYR